MSHDAHSHDAHGHDSHAADAHGADSHGAHHEVVDDGTAGGPIGWPFALLLTIGITAFALWTLLVPRAGAL